MSALRKDRFLKESENWINPTDIVAEHKLDDNQVLFVVNEQSKNYYDVLFMWDIDDKRIAVSYDVRNGSMQDVIDCVLKRCV